MSDPKKINLVDNISIMIVSSYSEICNNRSFRFQIFKLVRNSIRLLRFELQLVFRCHHLFLFVECDDKSKGFHMFLNLLILLFENNLWFPYFFRREGLSWVVFIKVD